MDLKIENGLKLILGIPKTLFFNFRVFPILTAIKMPVFITNNVRCKEVYKGCIKIQGNIKPFMIKIGVGGSEIINTNKGIIHISKKNKAIVIFEGKASLGEGTVIYANGNLTFGDNFSANKNCIISNNNDMFFGKDVLIGWNVNIRDSDGHSIINNNKKDVKVEIGNNVWICACVDILKGTKIGNNCVIAYRSCVCGLSTGDNILIAGYPAKEQKQNISWKR